MTENLAYRLLNLVRQKKPRIVVLGDSMEDVWLEGEYGECQDDCPCFRVSHEVRTPGGAANAFRQLNNWYPPDIGRVEGYRPAILMSALSMDRLWEDYGVDTRLCWEVQKVTRKIRVLAGGKIVSRVDVDEKINPLLPLWDVGFDLLADAVLIADYDKGLLSDENVQEIIRWSNDKDIPVVVDAKRAPEVYTNRGVGAFLKCNLGYVRAFETVGRFRKVIVTRGHRPPVYGDRIEMSPGDWKIIGVDGYHPLENPYPPVTCLNHVGAGDCFSAHLTLALGCGFSLEEAVRLAHSAGRVYVQHHYGRPPWPHEIAKDLDPVGGKVFYPDSTSETPSSEAGQSTKGSVARASSLLHSDLLWGLRRATDSASGRIVFTNGCFDLLGPQHVYLLEEAKKQGDILVVGVNDDAGVRRLKGPNRPVMPLEKRLEMLCAIGCVDYVAPFAEDTPRLVMEALKPDVRVKGDFPDLNRDGDDLAKKVVLVPPMPGWSTTGTMERIRG